MNEAGGEIARDFIKDSMLDPFVLKNDSRGMITRIKKMIKALRGGTPAE